MYPRDDSNNHDTGNDTDINKKKSNLDIGLQKEACREQVFTVACDAAAPAAAAAAVATTSSILLSTLARQNKRQTTNKTLEKKASASTEPPFE